MKSSSPSLRVLISFTLVITLTTVFTFRSFAAAEKRVKAEPGPLLQEPTGTVTVEGSVNVNGNAIQTGATLLSGSIISTGSGGRATIDLGTLGRIVVGDSTTVTLIFSPGSLQVTSQCSQTEIEVMSGEVRVSSPSVETLTGGKEKTYNGNVVAMTNGGTDFEIDCKSKKGAAGAFTDAGLLGLLALIGVGAAIAAGIAIGDEGPVTPINQPPVSPSVP